MIVVGYLCYLGKNIENLGVFSILNPCALSQGICFADGRLFGYLGEK